MQTKDSGDFLAGVCAVVEVFVTTLGRDYISGWGFKFLSYTIWTITLDPVLNKKISQ